MNLRRWLMPGIGIKRWLGVVFAGLFLLALAVAHVVRQATAVIHPTGFTGLVIDVVTLQFLPYPLRGLIVGVVGVGLIGVGGLRVLRRHVHGSADGIRVDAHAVRRCAN